MLSEIWIIATNKNKQVKALPLSSASLWGKRILLKHKRLAKNDQSKRNLIEACLISCQGAFLSPGDWLCFYFISGSNYYSGLNMAWGCCQMRAWGLVWGLCALKRPDFWMELEWNALVRLNMFLSTLNGQHDIWGHGQPGTGKILFCTQSICMSVWPSPAQG